MLANGLGLLFLIFCTAYVWSKLTKTLGVVVRKIAYKFS
jgi:hypothetical protein